MKKFKIIVGKQSAEIEPEEILEAIEAIRKGGIIALKHIVFNSSYFQAIVRDWESEESSVINKRYGIEDKSVSDFAGILSPKMKMLSPKEKNDALVESSAEERSKKSQSL